MIPTVYVSTKDDNNHDHHYRLPLTETVPNGHEITALRPAGRFQFSSLLSVTGLETLKAIRSEAGRHTTSR